MKARKTSFINLMKVLGALVNPKGITNHSYKPNLVLNAVFHSSPNFIRIFNAKLDVRFKELLNRLPAPAPAPTHGAGRFPIAGRIAGSAPAAPPAAAAAADAPQTSAAAAA